MAKSSFPAIADATTRVLVLGSLPGEVSLARMEYYGHPQNQFWRLMGAVVGTALRELPYRSRLAALAANGVGLWDVIQSADRVGSLDGAIRNHRPAALETLVETLPSLRAIGFNGQKASNIGRGQLGLRDGLDLITLPSSSPAYTIAFERKKAEWMRLKTFLSEAAQV